MEDSQYNNGSNFSSPDQIRPLIDRRKQIKLITIAIVALIILGMLANYMYQQYDQAQLHSRSDDQISVNESSTPSTLVDPITPDQDTTNQQNYTEWQIIDTNHRPAWPTGVALHQLGFTGSDVSRWNNYLIGLDIIEYVDRPAIEYVHDSPIHYETYHAITAVNIYDIDSGQIVKVPLSEPSIDFWDNAAQVVIDDTLYFGSNSRFGPGLNYKLDLPVTNNSVAQKMPVTLGLGLVKYGNSYVSASCYEGCTYTLFDPINLTQTPALERLSAADYAYDPDRLEKLVGFDSRGNYILQKYEEITARDYENNQPPVLKTVSIVAVPVSNEDLETTIIAQDQLPFTDFQSYMTDGQDKLLLLGENEAYVLDLITKEISAVNVNEDVFAKSYMNTDTSIRGNDHVVCLSYALNDGKGSIEEIAFNFETQSFDESISDQCEETWQVSTPEERFEQLDLPDNFVLSPK